MENTLFDYQQSTATPEHDWQRDLARAMDEQLRRDHQTLRDRGNWPPPWMELDKPLLADEARLLTAIADNCGLYWADNNAAICRETVNLLEMTATGNARYTITKCIQLGYVMARYDEGRGCQRLDLTEYGRDLLDDWEDEQTLKADNG